MCGVYGTLSFKGEPGCRDVLTRMGDVTRHRGPDDQGFHVDGPLALGMRRLSIIDVEGGKQPVSNEDGTVWAVCNGEIYNFRELRNLLKELGHQFSSGTDTEVIVHLYEEYELDFVQHLDGMFGLALWDSKSQRLVIARDRLGIKPMYIKRNASGLVFASELKAILRILDTTPCFDQVALREYMSLGYVPAPASIFEGIGKLEPATMLIAEPNGHAQFQQYWRPDPQPDRSARDWVGELEDQLQKSILSQMVSDVPIGAFLSGGIDSSTVVAYMAANTDSPVKTYSIGFDEDGAGALYNELAYARRVSDLFGTEHREIVVRPDVASLLPSLLWHLDEPIADSAFITTHLVSELASQDVKVILSGVGGDELFGGYRRYLGGALDKWARLIPRSLMANVLIPAAKRLPSDRHSRLMNVSRLAKAYLTAFDLPEAERYRRYVGLLDDADIQDLFSSPLPKSMNALGSAFAKARSCDSVSRLMEVDLLTQLPDDLLMLTDRMTMASSIECRVPLLDQDLVDLALSMPSSVKVNGSKLKWVLKQAAAKVLPDDIVNREKRGFGAPMGAWFKDSLREFSNGLLADDTLVQRGIFSPEAVQDLLVDHRHSREDHTDTVLALINFEVFARVVVDGRDPADVSDELRGLMG